ncbi:GH92 family glycosyl hydrolase [Pedobacter faecalis]|uniref:GH92 family glycosyl hydrolase n=1 Tax=Pedobacter faecalis TaxID=3041495 RepID=UPI00254FE99E|nr:GH92 family glycosyl hydrolase [Pedobacter sp. ELA7]
MNARLTLIAFCMLGSAVFSQQKNTATAQQPLKAPADYVDLYIGSINPKTRSTQPVIKAPGGNMSIFPAFNPAIEDFYLSDKIIGFPLGFGTLMIAKGDALDPNSRPSRFDHDLETATPYYYQVLLEDPNVNTEYTMTDNAAIFRFTIPANQATSLVLSVPGNSSLSGTQSILKGNVPSGRRGGPQEKRYFYAEVSKPANPSGSQPGNSGNTGYFHWAASAQPQTVEFKVGISNVSEDDAKATLDKEIGKSTFDQVKNKLKERWNAELNLINIKGGSERQRGIFYSTLYRTMVLRMGNVWDTYRSAYALQNLIRPQETVKAINNFIRAYETSGWLTSSGAMIGHHSTSVIVEAYRKGLRGFDVEKAYAGMRKNHMEATMIPWKDGGQAPITELEQCYFDNGFYPALPVRADAGKKDEVDKYSRLPYQVRWLPEVGVEETVKEVDGWHRRQSVSVTLEHAYDDWCLAQMAKLLGKTADYELFMKRAANYRNVFNPAIGMMAPKSADGKWVAPFDPIFSGGFAGEGYFAEGNSWTYTWHVQHDVQGLINLMGGNDNFNRKLDSLFIVGHRPADKLAFLGQFPDMTGLVGMYSQGNEPVYHIPYMYNYSGQPWKTQSRVRMLMDLWFDITPHGISGDEDGGATSSWYVLNSIGIYPQNPGSTVFDIGSPLFNETTINVGGGKSFVIEARNVSKQNKYIQSATLNGTALNKPWVDNADLIKGGRMVLVMGPRPNKNWGSKPGDAAPSMSAL